MELNTSTLMMIFFIVSLIISIWKIYAFLPNKELKDDDTTKESIDELKKLILKVIKDSDGKLNHKELCQKVKEHSEFDSEHFWRFNQNKLRQILNIHFIENPHLSSIEEIHKDLNRN